MYWTGKKINILKYNCYFCFLWTLFLSCVQISSSCSTPPAPCWLSSMAAVLLQRWTAWHTATLTSQTTTSSPLQVLLPLRRMSPPRSCWTPVWSRSIQLVALWFALNLWQRQRPARRLSSSCVNLVLLYQRPAQISWTNSCWCLFFYIIFFSTKYRQTGQCN